MLKALTAENQKWVNDTWEKIEKKFQKTSRSIGETIAYTTQNGKYIEWGVPGQNTEWWTNGFYPGLLWIMYKETGDEFYKTTAEKIEQRLDDVLYAFDGLHHDVGFMWLLSSVANYRITGNDESRKRGLLAASLLASRYNIDGGFIRAWNGDCKGWAIIDCMMNIPLLYWASEQINDRRFEKIAIAHANKAMDVFIRPDGSVNHIVVMDSDTGDVIETRGGQGYAEGSSWSRGQSWALYGFALSFIRTKNQAYLDTAKKVANYFLADLAMKDDFVPDCDFRQPKEKVLKDSSAGAIAACGLIEISKYVGEHEKDLYLNGALKILKALDEKCGVWDDSDQCFLTNGAEAYHTSPNQKRSPHNMALIYGDYYFTEAILKLKGSDLLLW